MVEYENGIIEMRDPSEYLIINNNLPVRFVGNDAVEYFVLNILYYSVFQIFSQHLQPHNPYSLVILIVARLLLQKCGL